MPRGTLLPATQGISLLRLLEQVLCIVPCVLEKSLPLLFDFAVRASCDRPWLLRHVSKHTHQCGAEKLAQRRINRLQLQGNQFVVEAGNAASAEQICKPVPWRFRSWLQLAPMANYSSLHQRLMVKLHLKPNHRRT